MLSGKVVEKSWGREEWVVNSFEKGYCGKFLFVDEGQRCSWHSHPTKDECFRVVSGLALVRSMPYRERDTLLAEGWDDESIHRYAGTRVLREGDSFHVPPDTLHQFEALTELVLAEFSTFHSDEDVVRVSP